MRTACGVSKQSGANIETLNSGVLIRKTPTKGTPSLWKQPSSPYDHINARHAFQGTRPPFKGHPNFWKQPYQPAYVRPPLGPAANHCGVRMERSVDTTLPSNASQTECCRVDLTGFEHVYTYVYVHQHEYMNNNTVYEYIYI